MRISNHRFAVETVRFSTKDCMFCKTSQNFVVEDEKHVLLNCPRYETLRKLLFENTLEMYPNFHKLEDQERFKYLLNSNGPII